MIFKNIHSHTSTVFLHSSLLSAKDRRVPPFRVDICHIRPTSHPQRQRYYKKQLTKEPEPIEVQVSRTTHANIETK